MISSGLFTIHIDTFDIKYGFPRYNSCWYSKSFETHFDTVVPRPSAALPLPCIKLSANRRTKTGRPGNEATLVGTVR